MATTPFSAAFEAQLKQKIQGGRLEPIALHVVYPQFFCCISGNTVGVDKDPVAHISAEVREICTETPFCVDISRSWSPTSSIVTYEVDWDDGNVSNGAWPPAGVVCHPFGGYALPGTYEVTVTVTDLLGATGQATVEVVAVECPPAVPEFPIVVNIWDVGPAYVDDIYATPPTWTLMNNGLTASRSKRIFDMLHYVMPDGRETIFAGTACGIYRYEWLPCGSGEWKWRITNTDILYYFGLTGTVRVEKIVMDPTQPGRGFAAVGVNINGATGEAACLFIKTDDYWESISGGSVVYHAVGSWEWRWQSLALANHSDGQTLYYTRPAVYKSTNGGASWNIVDNVNSNESSIVCPWYAPNWDDSIVAHAETGLFAFSDDFGATWTDETGVGRTYQLEAAPHRNDLFYIFCETEIFEYEVGVGLSSVAKLDAADDVFDGQVLTYDSGYADYILAIGHYPGGGPMVELWRRHVTPSQNKRGNLPTLAGGNDLSAMTHPFYQGDMEWP